VTLLAHFVQKAQLSVEEGVEEGFINTDGTPTDRFRGEIGRMLGEAFGESGLLTYRQRGVTCFSEIANDILLAGRIVFQHVGGARWDDPACVDYLVSLANSQE
jgi:hypothetical protein